MADYHLKALHLARDGKWDASHKTVQDHDDAFACHIHAYLHRVEGDLGNANYWYRRAGVCAPVTNVDDELSDLIMLAESRN